MTTALFAGSFVPFTIGHADIVTRGLRLFDSVVIAIGVHDKKQPLYTSEERLRQISSFDAEERRIKVIAYTGLTADIAKEVGATVLLRGIRSGLDYEYERSLADINRCLTGIETVFLFTAQHLSHVSSGAIRELINYGHDVSGMLPPGFVL